MEAKIKDQEEELDEQAGTIQMLEQVQMLTGCSQTAYVTLANSVITQKKLYLMTNGSFLSLTNFCSSVSGCNDGSLGVNLLGSFL